MIKKRGCRESQWWARRKGLKGATAAFQRVTKRRTLTEFQVAL